MRPISIILALAVALALYGLVIERDRVMALAGVQAPAASEAAVEQAADPAAEARTAATGAAEPGRVSVVALRSEARPIEDVTMVRGETAAVREVEVRAETSGTIISEPLRRGARVDAGDVLCRLDPGTRASSLDEADARLVEARARLPEARARVPEAQALLAEARARVAEGEARVAEANARLQEAQINSTAATRLSEGGYASQTRVANSEAALESAKAGVVSAEASLDGIKAQIAAAEAGVESAGAQVDGALAGIRSAEAGVATAQREIARLEIAAPFGGILESDTAELGALLQPGGVCATVIELDRVKLVGFLPETALASVREGAPARARLTTGEEVQGQVTFLSRSSDPQTRTFRVEVEVPNPDLAIRDGQTVEMVIAVPGAEAHLVPQSALTLDDEGRLGLRVAEDGVARFLPVEVQRDTPDGTWVSGLPSRADIIVVGQEYVSDGVPVEVTYRKDGA